MTDDVASAQLGLQGAAVTALKASARIASFVAARVYDEPPDPATAVFPYITLGDGQSVSTPADGYDGSDDYFNVHAWSRKPGFPEVKRIATAVRGALNLASLTLNPDPPDAGASRVVAVFHMETRYLRDPDGITSHAVVMFCAFTEPA